MRIIIQFFRWLSGALETQRLLNVILERIFEMPTKQEVKDAITAAVAEEAGQVADRIKALEARIEELIAAGSDSWTDEDLQGVLTQVRGIVTPV